MSSSGQQLVAGRVPGERIATTVRTSDGSATSSTTEQGTDSVTAALVSGRTYRITSVMHLTYTVAADRFLHRIRTDTTSGTQLNYERDLVPSSVAGPWPSRVEAEFTASATGDQVFLGTLAREAGTGTAQARGASTNPGYLYVDYIRG